MRIAIEHAERMAIYHEIEAGELVDHGAKPDQYKNHVIAQRSIMEEFAESK